MNDRDFPLEAIVPLPPSNECVLGLLILAATALAATLLLSGMIVGLRLTVRWVAQRFRTLPVNPDRDR